MIIPLFKKKRIAGATDPRVQSWMIMAQPIVMANSPVLSIIQINKGYMQHGIEEQNRVRPNVG
jgi:hypothetical protein